MWTNLVFFLLYLTLVTSCIIDLFLCCHLLHLIIYLWWSLFKRKKRFPDFFWYQKIKNVQKILKKTPYRRVAQKRYNFAPGAANHTFFDSPCIYLYIYIFVAQWQFLNNSCYGLFWWSFLRMNISYETNVRRHERIKWFFSFEEINARFGLVVSCFNLLMSKFV